MSFILRLTEKQPNEFNVLELGVAIPQFYCQAFIFMFYLGDGVSIYDLSLGHSKDIKTKNHEKLEHVHLRRVKKNCRPMSYNVIRTM